MLKKITSHVKLDFFLVKLLMKRYFSPTFGSALIIGGTAIGAGMLGLPMATGSLGFWIASLAFFGSFLYMLLSLFFLLEATLMCSKEEGDLISMVKERLGSGGGIVAWFSFLLLLYAVAAAYLSGGGSLLATWLGHLFSIEIAPAAGLFLFLVCFGCIVVFETRSLDFFNRICMLGLFISFAILIGFGVPHVKKDHLAEGSLRDLPLALPIIALSFTSHIIVPSLRSYLRNNVSKLKRALFWGSLIPLAFYLVWEWLVIGMLPLEGKQGLLALKSSPYPVAELTAALTQKTGTHLIGILVGAFSFFAIVTSFFGVALSLYNFLADGLRIKKTKTGKLGLLVLMFTPPTLFALFFPTGFLLALGYAGVFVAILYGLLPALMVWKGRYRDQKKTPFRVFGGKVTLIVLFLGSLAIIAFQLLHR